MIEPRERQPQHRRDDAGLVPRGDEHREAAVRAHRGQVGEHLALGAEQRRIAAAAVPESCHVVGDLTLQELTCVVSTQRELPALGAVQQRAGADGGAVLRLEVGE